MKKVGIVKVRTIFSGIVFCIALNTTCQPPQLTLIIILDQLSYTMMQQQKPYFQHGLKLLTDHGITYTQCYQPLAAPKTAPGHATFATGAPPRYHGITDNTWFTYTDKQVTCDESSKYQVFTPNGKLTSIKKGPDNLRLDTIFDQLSIYGPRDMYLFSIAGKSRAATMFAGHSGQAYWFDHTHGGFVSSQAYVQQLPAWVRNFNMTHIPQLPASISWNPIFTSDHNAYTTSMTAYHGSPNKPQFNQTISLSQRSDEPYKAYIATPEGQRQIIRFAQTALEQTYKQNRQARITMCVSLSSLDYVGHYYGPESKEYRDMLYHADRDIQTLIDKIYTYIPKEQACIIFTSDHGTMPIPEQAAQAGIAFAQRVDGNALVRELNKQIFYRFRVHNLIATHSQPYIYFNQKKWRKLDTDTQIRITEYIQKILREKPYIIDAYHSETLPHINTYSAWEPLRFLQLHNAPDRVGDIVYLIRPYCNITEYQHGTTHATPYACDTHVPLIVYQPGSLGNHSVSTKVSGEQIAPTLADILSVPRPNGAYASRLPFLETPQHTA